ncbi:lectin MOA-related protein [Xenorhabdus bovienii]|uniref:lectin MOA-related protein n=1 Tax=Xenorhabdus bovienii TaxID=40576 RepID=UPI0023B2920A|nr:lectin MOA-related protein [Xenorhabdus bovienii]MDE9493094.1 lectin MOA-related protein [Xenorhabdus bovienii]MDE9501630.1 lectin MOA-related protein [Xenorhabdus bovienii]MDE9525845.1 lectin MOA-related protein [Xenorhabdus bovienii]MDE9569157.1 lectin MOA-related protein [Xenorhabdus bovienii]
MEKKDKAIKTHSVFASNKSTLSEEENIHHGENPISLSPNESDVILIDDVESLEDDTSPHASYFIKDTHGRTLCIDDKDKEDLYFESDEKPAFMGSEDYSANFIMLQLRDKKIPENSIKMIGEYNDKKYVMYAYDNSIDLTSTKLYWHTRNPSIDDRRISFNKEYVKTEKGLKQYRLVWNNQGTEMFLYSHSHDESRSLLTANNKKYSLFTLHADFIKEKLIKPLVKKTWPNIKLRLFTFRILDPFYKLVSDEKVRRIYKESGLENFKYRKNSFDCDDFSFVYKAQASKEAYSNNEKFGYAIGVIFGVLGESVHAVNIFIDHDLKVKLIKPQHGEIIEAKDWEYTPFYILI